MKYITIPLFGCLLVLVGTFFGYPTPAHAAITLVNGAYANGASSPSTSTTLTAGNVLVVFAAFNAAGSGCGAHTITMSDGGDTFVQVSKTLNQNYNCAEAFVASTTLTGTKTISMSDGTSQNGSFSFTQWSGAAVGTIAQMVDASSSGTGASSPVKTGTFSTSHSGDMIVGGAEDYYSISNAYSAGTTQGTAMTLAPNSTSTKSGVDGYMLAATEYLLESGTLTNASTSINISGEGSVYNNMFVVALIPAGSSTPSSAAPIPACVMIMSN
jgi:hypothetical protein